MTTRRPPWRESTRTQTLACGDGFRSHQIMPPQYPCVQRFRDRRLLAYLFFQGCQGPYRAMLGHTCYFFSVEYLQLLASEGWWTEAQDYICPCFVYPEDPYARNGRSVEGHVLVYFIRCHVTIAQVLSGTETAASLAVKLKPYPWEGRIRPLMFTLLHSPQVRAALDWQQVWSRAAVIIRDLANKTPELKDKLLLPACPMDPHNILPITPARYASFHRRRHLKKPVRRRPVQPSAIAKLFLEKRSSLPSSTHCSSPEELSPIEFDRKVMDWLADLLDKCFEASKRPDLFQRFILQPSNKKGPSEEGCHTGNSLRGSRPRKKPREELAIAEDYLNTKRQRTAREASPSATG